MRTLVIFSSSLALMVCACDIGCCAGKTGALDIRIGEPLVVAVAEHDEGWGRFCFPNIGQWQDGTISVSYSISADAVNSYGSAPVPPVERIAE